MEGVSIEPHHEVKQTVTDFYDEKDTAIEYVLNELISVYTKTTKLTSYKEYETLFESRIIYLHKIMNGDA